METRSMALKMLVTAAVTVLLSVVTQAASAHVSAPQTPSALVEDVKSATAGVEFMDYVGAGQVIKLKPGDVLVLSYLASCEYETITGGTVIVGSDRSNVEDGKIVRAKVPCNGGIMQLSAAEASQSAASAFRVQSAETEPTLYARSPLIQLPKVLGSNDRILLIERIDRRGERHEIKINDAVVAAGFYDTAKTNLSLTRGAIYVASIGGQRAPFRIDAKAKSGSTPIISRLLRFQ
jgi:hypothetical protein